MHLTHPVQSSESMEKLLNQYVAKHILYRGLLHALFKKWIEADHPTFNGSVQVDKAGAGRKIKIENYCIVQVHVGILLSSSQQRIGATWE